MFEYHDAYAPAGRGHADLLDALHALGLQTQEYRNFISRALHLETGIIYAHK